MKSLAAQLLAPAVFVPDAKGKVPIILGTGSIVLGREYQKPSPLTGGAEWYVTIDPAPSNLAHVLWSGWLAAGTPVARRPPIDWALTTLPLADGDKLNAWDRLRQVLAVKHWTTARWCTTFTLRDQPLTRNAIRTLGGNISEHDSRATLGTMLFRLTTSISSLPKESVQMAKTTAAAAPAKAGIKPSTAKVKKAKEPVVRENSASKSCAAALTELGVKHPAIAKLAADQDCKASELQDLRDHVNEKAMAAREANKPARATKLSIANRLVRRLARKA